MAATTASRVLKTESATTTRIRPSAKWLVHVFLVVLMIVWLVPSIGLLITSFRPQDAIASSGWWTAFSPARFTVDNYAQVLNAQGMGQSFVNSFLITLPSTLLPVIIASLAAYAFAWIWFPGRDFVYLKADTCPLITSYDFTAPAVMPVTK